MDETENKLGDSLVGITEIGKWESEDKEAHQLLSALYTYFKKMAPLTKNVDKLINKINDFETLKNSFFHRGIWCGHQKWWKSYGNFTLSYDKMFFSDSNMEISEAPLNIRTGKISKSYRSDDILNS